MTNLFIANVRADYPDSVRTKADLIDGTAVGSDTTSRFLWHASAGDVVVLPERMVPHYASYVDEMLRMPQDALRIIEYGGLLTDEALLDSATFDAIKEAVGQKGDVVVQPFVHTRGTVELARLLGASEGPGASFAHENGVDLLNSKANFRKLAAGVGLPIAPGRVARSERELSDELRRLQGLGCPLIAKHDHAGGGHGNIILSPKSASRSKLPGARRFLDLEDSAEKLARELWNELTDNSYSMVTLEVYMESRERFYLEYDLTGRVPHLVSTGSIRYSEHATDVPPKWTGLDVPFNLDAVGGSSAVSQGQLIVSAVHALGYRGMLNLDGITTLEGELVFQEVNARWGGGLVYDVIARRLLGESYSRTHVLRSLLDLPTMDHVELQRRLTAAGVHYSHERKEGALILASRSDLGGGAEILLIASRDRGPGEVETKVREVLTS
ncbi:hypothetical protein [Kocuria marina]|uniref:preATP grasp domain-containing protein n=1 Tax=Kocuria marina TaxID=223184 RepID=UPI00345FAB02